MRGANVGVTPDFMDSNIGAHRIYDMFGEPISSLDVAILHDLGYGSTVPGWAQPIPAAAFGPSALACFMLVGEMASPGVGMQSVDSD
jgi:hypothetical protein